MTVQKLLRLVVILVSTISPLSSPARSNEAFNITYDKPPKGYERIIGSAWFIYVSGVFDEQSATTFANFLQQNDVPIRSTVILNSPGGSLFGGMEIGRLIRKHRLNTDVGIRKANKQGRREYAPGFCYSSCTYAYLGGVFRYLTEGSHYGLHRFYSNSPGYGSMDMAQIASAQIVSYLREMGINPELFSLSTKAGEDEIFEPSRATLEKLDAVNNGWTPPVWTVESRGGMLYLKGERDTQFGYNKLIFYCGTNSNLVLHIIIDPQGHSEELNAMPSHSLLIDGIDQPIEPSFKRTIQGSFNAIYSLTNEQMTSIMIAKSVGVVIRPSPNSPLFLGFNAMPFGGAGEKLVGIANSCIPH